LTAACKVHRVTQHRSVLPGVEARTITSDRTFPRHSHDQLGIGVVLSGAHRSWSGIGHVEARAGDSIMVNPGEMHDGMPGGQGPRQWRMLYFEPAVVARATRAEGVEVIEVVRPAVHDPVLASLFVRSFDRVIEQPSSELAIEESLLMLVMRALRKHGARQTPSRELSPSVRRALERVEADPASQTSLAELARLSGISRFQLVRGFVREVGVTPHAYVLQRRVLLARQLLTLGQSIVEAAMNAGFADQSHLTRAFLRQFGVTPGRYLAAIN
jgi:AraC-like DNA-binding protein/quercetin dioxygenase-like cupin family protein